MMNGEHLRWQCGIPDSTTATMFKGPSEYPGYFRTVVRFASRRYARWSESLVYHMASHHTLTDEDFVRVCSQARVVLWPRPAVQLLELALAAL